MKRAAQAAVALASGLTVLGVGAGPVSASQPAFHFVEDVTGETFECTSTSYNDHLRLDQDHHSRGAEPDR